MKYICMLSHSFSSPSEKAQHSHALERTVKIKCALGSGMTAPLKIRFFALPIPGGNVMSYLRSIWAIMILSSICTFWSANCSIPKWKTHAPKRSYDLHMSGDLDMEESKCVCVCVCVTLMSRITCTKWKILQTRSIGARTTVIKVKDIRESRWLRSHISYHWGQHLLFRVTWRSGRDRISRGQDKFLGCNG